MIEVKGDNWVIKKLYETQAIMEGHFLLSSGLHSQYYIQCAKILQYPRIAEKIGEKLARYFRRLKVNVVIGPAIGAIILVHTVARALNARALFLEREKTENEKYKFSLRRGFTIYEGENILVVEDVLTTGGSVKEVIENLKNKYKNINIVGIASIINRANDEVINELKNFIDEPSKSINWLVKISIPTYTPESCPLCKTGIPLEKPGSNVNLKV